MVRRLVLLKMLHCKKSNGKSESSPKRETTGEGASHNVSSREIITIKKEDGDDNLLCRVCLKDGCIPIHGNHTFDDISETVMTFGGIEVRIEDPYPKFICELCNTLLQSAILFRKTAQQSDELLKHPIEKNWSESSLRGRVKKVVADNNDTMDYVDADTSSEYEECKVKQQSYHCKKCEIKFDTFKEFNEHKISEEHENMRAVCPICNKSYNTMYLKKHLALHKQEAPYMCDICGKNFIMQGHFTRHRLTHFYKLPFKCSLCPYKGRFSESLKMHMRSHTGEKPYQCAECPSRFVSKSNLNKHTLTHKSEHDFKCEFCGRGFYKKRELELHFKVDHTGIKDHVCNICGKAFGYRKQMMKHQLKVHKRAKLKSGRMPLYLKVEAMKQQGKNISIES